MSYSDLLIHIGESLDEAALADLARDLGEQRGVLSTCISADRRHLVLVQFDPRDVRPSDLVRQVRSRGLAAQLVGL